MVSLHFHHKFSDCSGLVSICGPAHFHHDQVNQQKELRCSLFSAVGCTLLSPTCPGWALLAEKLGLPTQLDQVRFGELADSQPHSHMHGAPILRLHRSDSKHSHHSTAPPVHHREGASNFRLRHSWLQGKLGGEAAKNGCNDRPFRALFCRTFSVQTNAMLFSKIHELHRITSFLI